MSTDDARAAASATDAGDASDAGHADKDQAVLRYLQALEAGRAAAATSPDPDPDRAGPALAGAEMVTGDDREGLEVQLAESTPGSGAQAATLEDAFVSSAADYGQRHGITYDGWREAGVDAEVLARAGIERTAE
jgi:hypothetical protein